MLQVLINVTLLSLLTGAFLYLSLLGSLHFSDYMQSKREAKHARKYAVAFAHS